MTEETKEAVRLLWECCNELRLHDLHTGHNTNCGLKDRLIVFFEKHQFVKGSKIDIDKVCDELCLKETQNEPS